MFWSKLQTEKLKTQYPALNLFANVISELPRLVAVVHIGKVLQTIGRVYSQSLTIQAMKLLLAEYRIDKYILQALFKLKARGVITFKLTIKKKSKKNVTKKSRPNLLKIIE